MQPHEPDLQRDWPRHLLGLGLLAIFAFVVLTLAFLRVIEGLDPAVVGESQAVPDAPATPGGAGDGPAPSDGEGSDAETGSPDDPAVGGLSEPGEGAEGAPDGAARDALPPASSIAPDPQLPLAPEGFVWARDEQLGLRVHVPEGWRSAVPEPDEVQATYAADYDRIFEAPDGSERLAFSEWEAEGRAPLLLFVPSVAEGMRSVGGEQPFNARISGHPALLLSGSESPTTPLRYAAFLERAGRYVRVTWATYDGDPDATAFQRALASVHWPDDMVEGANAALAPRQPAGLYFGSDRLFGDPYP